MTTTSDPTDKPGVLVLPPLLYLAALVIGYALQAVFPMTLPFPAYVRWVGGAVILAGIAFGGTARITFARAGTNTNPRARRRRS